MRFRRTAWLVLSDIQFLLPLAVLLLGLALLYTLR
jgi:hypothetical protein